MSSRTQDVVLAIDNGTQSVRALLVDPAGNVLAKSRVPIQAYFSEHPGWAEQQPEYFWTMLCQACQQLWQQTGIPKAAIKGVTLTTQRGTVVNLDRDGKPLPDIVQRYKVRDAKKDTNRKLKYFMVPKKEIVENKYDLNLSTYKEEVYEEVVYEKPNKILKKLSDIEQSINNGINELTQLTK